MKTLLKILAWPVTLALTIVTALCAAILSCAASILALAGALLTILALALLLSGSPHNAAIVAVIAFLVSPPRHTDAHCPFARRLAGPQPLAQRYHLRIRPL